MSEHLEISRVAMGEATETDRIHLASCAECQGEAARFEDALGMFRASAQRWGAEEFASVDRVDSLAPAPRSLHPAWAMAVILLLSLLGFRMSLQPRSEQPAVMAYADADAELMDQVRADLARPEPRGMEPLRATADLLP
jgi:hypothetical protein